MLTKYQCTDINCYFWNVLGIEAIMLIPFYMFMYKITYEAFLSLFYRIGDIGLRQFLEGPSSIRIRELNLSNCALLGDASIVKLSERYEKPIYTIALAIVYLLAEKVRERPWLQALRRTLGCPEGSLTLSETKSKTLKSQTELISWLLLLLSPKGKFDSVIHEVMSI